MGVVFAATHQWTERPVALKLLHPQYASDPEIRQRFLREARTAARLEHDHVVDVLDMGLEDDGAVYLVLEMLDGRPLDSFVEEHKRMSPRLALSVLLPVLDAVNAAHEQNILHRDLKPDNIFVHRRTDRVVPKVVDFGIAKVVEQGHSLTSTGAVIGTPHYMSPEQIRGASDLGPAADVWSMGVVLYELLSGHLPFERDSAMAILLAISSQPPADIEQHVPDLPAGLVAVLRRSLARELGDRFSTMREFSAALQEVADAEGWDLESPLRGEWLEKLNESSSAAAHAETAAGGADLHTPEGLLGLSRTTPRDAPLSAPAGAIEQNGVQDPMQNVVHDAVSVSAPASSDPAPVSRFGAVHFGLAGALALAVGLLLWIVLGAGSPTPAASPAPVAPPAIAHSPQAAEPDPEPPAAAESTPERVAVPPAPPVQPRPQPAVPAAESPERAPTPTRRAGRVRVHAPGSPSPVAPSESEPSADDRRGANNALIIR